MTLFFLTDDEEVNEDSHFITVTPKSKREGIQFVLALYVLLNKHSYRIKPLLTSIWNILLYTFYQKDIMFNRSLRVALEVVQLTHV